MKLGIITRANNRGLGIQGWEFYRHLNPYKTLVVALSCDDEEIIKQYNEGNVVVSRGMVREDDFLFFEDCDVVLSFETFYNDHAIEKARSRKNCPAFVLQPNYEQQNNAAIADGLIIPTIWNFDKWEGKKIYLPVPIARDVLPFRERTQARVFVHNSGTQLGDDRNGTIQLLKAMQYVESDITLIVRVQKMAQMMYNEVVKLAGKDKRIFLDTRTFQNYWDLWQEGDVFIYPRSYGGLALPTNEAMSVGMPVVMPDMKPQNGYLPKELLLPVSERRMIQMFKPVEASTVDVQDIARSIDTLYQMKTISHLSQQMNEVAKFWSWENLLPKYKATLQEYAYNKRKS